MNADIKNDADYFKLYEDRYRRIYEQGIDYWISDPDDFASQVESIDAFMDYAGCDPSKTRVIELGCGEGHVARHLLERGFSFLGVDISESAIEKAREMTSQKRGGTFIMADVTDLSQVNDRSFHAAIDSMCLQMLVTDDHRARYFTEVKRILKGDGKAYFHENIQQKEFTGKISSFQEFVETCYGDYSELHDYPAYINGKRQTLQLPRIPARFNNEQGYRKELMEAGFNVEHFSISGTQCIIYAGVRDSEKKKANEWTNT